MSTARAQFHLAFPVRDLDEARAFYRNVIGCTEGRSTSIHIDFNMFGHHVVAHLVKTAPADAASSEFDGREVPVPHFGLNLEWDEWEQLAGRLTQNAANFRDPPHVRLKGRVGEHATLFVYDPSGNALEFKAFRDPSEAFAVDLADVEAEQAANAARASDDNVRTRVTAVIVSVCGAAEEELARSGLVDSVRAMELLIALQKEFAVTLPDVTTTQLSSITSIVSIVNDARRRAR